METTDLHQKASSLRASSALSFVPKLKLEHVRLTSFSRMRVDLAAQVSWNCFLGNVLITTLSIIIILTSPPFCVSVHIHVYKKPWLIYWLSAPLYIIIDFKQISGWLLCRIIMVTPVPQKRKRLFESLTTFLTVLMSGIRRRGKKRGRRA